MPQFFRPRIFGIIALAVLVSVGAGAKAFAFEPQDPGSIAPGHDLYTTFNGTLQFDSGVGITLPVNFFGPGSLTPTGPLDVAGSALGGALGTTDTIIERQGDTSPIPIELVALHLQSVEPLAVGFGDGSTQLWDVDIGLSSTPSTGLIDVIGNPSGGFIGIQINVFPLIMFSRVGGSDVRVYDFGAEEVPGLNLVASAAWASSCPGALQLDDPDLGIATTAGFCPGTDPATGETFPIPLFDVSGMLAVNVVRTPAVPATGSADLALFLAVGPFVALRPDGFDVQVTVANRGPDPVADAAVTLDVPPDMMLFLGSVPLGAGSVTVPVGPLGVGESVLIQLTTSDSDAILVPVTARVSSGTADPDGTNNAYRSVVVMGRSPDGAGDVADLRTTITATPPRFVIARRLLGAPSYVTYEIVVTNPGLGPARDVALGGVLFGTRLDPMWLADVIPSQGSCDLFDPRDPDTPLTPPVWSLGELTIPCQLGDIPPGGDARVTITQGTGGPTLQRVYALAGAAGDTGDPAAGDNESAVVVPDNGVLGDATGDGLVTLTDDRLAVFFCIGETVEEVPICASADVNGDGVVDGLDVSLVTQNKTSPPNVTNNSAPIEKLKNEQHNDFGLLILEWKQQALSFFDRPLTKTNMLGLLGPVDGIIELPTNTPRTVINGSERATFDLADIPDDYVVGPTGCNSCIGVLVIPPDGTGVKAFHFTSTDDVLDVLEDEGPYEPGSRVAFCGGNNTEGSNLTLLEVTEFFFGNPLFDIVGYSDTDALGVNNQGDFTLIRPQDKASTNVP